MRPVRAPQATLSRAILRPALIAAAAGALVVFAATALIGPGTNTARAGGPVVTRADDPTADGCDPGDCSLREAIESTIGGETISFNIPGAGPHVIKPTSELPGLVDSVSIDGYTQPGASPNTAAAWYAGNASLQIVLDGSLAGAGVNGLSIGGTAVLIRGLVIQNFSGNGIMVGAFANGAIIGNYLGTDPTGTFAAPNDGSGVNVHGSGTAIGGSAPADRNLISGNAADGIQMNGEGPILIAGNFIGTGVTGTAPLPNGNDGVRLRDGTQSLIGNSNPGSGNLISGNARNGLTMEGLGVRGVLVRANRLGTAGDGTTPLPNSGHGIYLALGAFGNTIGGVSMANWNTIAYNGGDGVALAISAGVDNYLDPNITHSNGGLGADLKDDGVTLNDLDDPDTGPNDVMNFPVLTRAEVVDGFLEVEGTLNTAPVPFLPIFIFANSECDPTGFGEGERFLGETIAQGVGSNRTFTATIPLAGQPVFDGEVITTSVSNPESSSEFSECLAIVGAPTPDVDSDGVPDGIDNCPNWHNPTQVLPPWPIPADDPDCDGFDTTTETFLGTDPLVQCAADSTSNNEPTPDKWPVDHTDDQVVNLLDVAPYIAALNSTSPGPPYAARLDLNLSGGINLFDLVPYIPVLNNFCGASAPTPTATPDPL